MRLRDRRATGRRVGLGVVALAAAAAGVSAVPAPGAHASGSPSARAAAEKGLDTSSDYTWPRMGYSPANSDVSPDPGISNANASQLGLKWMAPNGTAAMSSPVSGYSPGLGKDLVFQGTESGSLNALDAATGQQVWSTNLGSAIRDTPLVEGNYVWVSPTYSPAMYKIDTSTGQVVCKTPMISTNNASATIGQPAGGKLSIYTSELDYGVSNGPIYSIDEATCAVNWTFTAYPTQLPQFPLGAWDPLAFTTDANGRSLLVYGTSNPGQIDALDAMTGKLDWYFTTTPAQPGAVDNDVGAGVTVTAPGVNGFADGMVYVGEEGGYFYAADLTTGKVQWVRHIAADFNLPKPFTRSTAAVVGTDVIFGTSTGVLCLDAVTGDTVWNWTDDVGGNPISEVLGAVTLVGPPDQQVVAVDDLAGGFNVLDAGTGSLLYHYELGGFAVQSVSDVNGTLVTAASNGFTYDFAVGGGNSGVPATTVDSPAPGSRVANDASPVTISGTATGGPIGSVLVGIQSGGPSGPWWDASSGTWTAGFFANPASLTDPGGSSTTWSIPVSVPPAGGVYTAFATAVGSDGIADTTAYSGTPGTASDSFSVDHEAGAPYITTLQGVYVAPGQTVQIGGSAFAANETIKVSLAGKVLATVQAGPKGGFTKSYIPIPPGSPFGTNLLTAVGQTSGYQAVTPIDVSNSWTSAGDGSLGQAFEPNDTTFQFHISPSLGQFLSQAWSYSTSASFHTSPTVNRGVLYFANDAGTVGALDIHTGAPMWAYAAGVMVDSTPAVGSGEVVFGEAPAGGSAGAVVALSAATGAPLWTVDTKSPVESAPQIANGTLYVGSDNGLLYAIGLTTGTVLWAKQAGGAITDSPAVDPVKHLVVFGDASGAVTALNSSTGAVVWTSKTGNAVTASPTIVNGAVLVGSTDGTVYSLEESSGATNWTYAAGASIPASGCAFTAGAKEYNQYVFGTSAGAMDYLDLSTGSFLHNYQAGSPIVAVDCAKSWAVFETADGRAIGAKYPSQFSWEYTSAAGFASGAAISDGVVYLTGLDHTVDAFTIPGQQIP